ncbi:MAG TPA: TetR/AcrR family transcriptional regulator [Clostridiaceae bacterium]|nr:TetR/AcrR family transcriptional regulator [Clostridiaceae bacterium]
MYESFENLPEDKKKRIIEASINEFAKNGYEKASTNSIVKAAGISKGLLFHYFGSKKNLYLYIVDYVSQYLIKKFYEINEKPSPDIFERLLEQGIIKLKLAYEHPLMYELLYKAFVNTPEELKSDIQERYLKLYAYNAQRFYKGFDTSKFREDINPQKAIELIMLFLEGLYSKYINTYRYKKISPEAALAEIEKITGEVREYFDILKKGMYK